ncbi:MAG: methionine--tRNA ligase [Candidatus Levyibacteriota bacterium]
MDKKFFLTNAIPYVNAKPHVGHALEFVQSSVIANYHRLLGEDVLTLCGGDENAIKNVQAAEKEGKPIREFIDENTKLFEDLAIKLDAKFDVFQKGSNKNHYTASQKLWELCQKNGDIYKKSYTGLYCVGCEQFYEKEELNENGECYEHPGKKLEEVQEENYFFKLSKYQDRLQKILEDGTIQIIPESRKNEVLSFLKQGLKDISVSRSNARAKNWGVPIPGDDSQRMYVWFDALNIYQSGIGFATDEETYNKWWPANVHVIGKGIIRFHAVYWPAFLLSAGLELPKSIFVHGYFTVDGQKMSKTVGNVIDPLEMIEKYGVDALRYYLLSQIPSTGDGDFSETKLKEVYNADLANGLGNLVARVARLCEKVNVQGISQKGFSEEIKADLNSYSFHTSLEKIWHIIRETDKYINEQEPWKITDEKKLAEVLGLAVGKINEVAFNLQPFLPGTSEKILQQFSGQVKSSPPLFPRLG